MDLQLFFTNLPYNCSDRELKEWIESRGIETRTIRIIRDVVSGASPAFAYADLKDDMQLPEAILMLDGKKMRNQTISVTKAALRNPMESTTVRIAKA
jgi:RNA recognition motif-containing protein